MAQLMFSAMGAFAEFERVLLQERQREGIALAKQRGVYRGRKRALTTGKCKCSGSRRRPGRRRRPWPRPLELVARASISIYGSVR